MIDFFRNLWKRLKSIIWSDRVKVKENSDGTVDFDLPSEKSTINGTEVETVDVGGKTDLNLTGKSAAVNNGDNSYDIYI